MHKGGEFRPRMDARTRGLRTLAPLAFRRFAGAIADVWDVRGEEGGGGFYIAPDPRIVNFLDETPPPMVLHARPNTDGHRDVVGFYIPAGVPLWSRMERGETMSHIDFHLAAPALEQRLAAADVRADLSRPRLIAASPSLAALGRIAAQEVRHPRRGEMMLDGLLSATLGEIFSAPAQPALPAMGGLSPFQFAAVERHLRQNIGRQISVAELAQVAGLSESWFAHCFKQYQGETPLRWQLRLRLEAVETMMADPALSLAEIAHAAGFADQAHLSRQFRAMHGMPPSVWRRGRFPPA